MKKKKVKIICSQCLKEFERCPSNIRKSKNSFCSQKCMSNFKEEKKVRIICKQCGKEFTILLCHTKRSQPIFCSRKCFNDNKSEKNISVVCEQCGQEFNKRLSSIKRTKQNFCSRKCTELFRKGKRPSEEDFKKRFMKYVEIIDGQWMWNLKCKGDVYGKMLHNGKRKHVNRLCYELFVGEITDGMFVCHKYDDNPRNITPENLFLGTLQDNIADMVRKNRQAKGETNANAKFTEKEVIEMRRLYATGEYSHATLAKKLGLKRSRISGILCNKTWKYLL